MGAKQHQAIESWIVRIRGNRNVVLKSELTESSKILRPHMKVEKLN